MKLNLGDDDYPGEKRAHLQVIRDEDDIIPYLKKLNSALLKENQVIRQKLDILESYVEKYGVMPIK